MQLTVRLFGIWLVAGCFISSKCNDGEGEKAQQADTDFTASSDTGFSGSVTSDTGTGAGVGSDTITSSNQDAGMGSDTSEDVNAVTDTAVVTELSVIQVNPQIPSRIWSEEIVAFGDNLLFTAEDYSNDFGAELWISDGTSAGTRMLKELNPGIDGSGIKFGGDAPAVVGGVVYFQARDDTHGTELWRSDGTPEGTYLLKDINVGGENDSSSPYHFVVLHGTLYFSADDGTHGTELWRSDGTDVGTVMVKDINDGSGGIGSGGLAVFNNQIFMDATDGSGFNDTHGNELWQSNGSEEGTFMVKDIAPDVINGDAMSSSPRYFSVFQNTLIFAANGELWKTDGTTEGTVQVKDISPGGISNPRQLEVGDEKVFFTADHEDYGHELWVTNGTEAGTHLVKDIMPGSESGSPDHLTYANGLLYFSAKDPVLGEELWVSDGTEAGTKLVSDIKVGASSSSPEQLILFNGGIYFAADDGVSGQELWRTDGSAEGTMLVADIEAGPDDSELKGFVIMGNNLYFGASGGDSQGRLWMLATE